MSNTVSCRIMTNSQIKNSMEKVQNRFSNLMKAGKIDKNQIVTKMEGVIELISTWLNYMPNKIKLMVT